MKFSKIETFKYSNLDLMVFFENHALTRQKDMFCIKQTDKFTKEYASIQFGTISFMGSIPFHTLIEWKVSRVNYPKIPKLAIF